MAFISTYFSYNGVRSEDMGISLIHDGSGVLMESQFFGEQQLISEQIPGRMTPYYYNRTVSPLNVRMLLSPMEGMWTSELKSRVSRWLNNGKFNEFYSTDDIDRIYFLSYLNATLHESGMFQGWLEVEFQNLDCYIRSPERENIFDLSGIGAGSKVVELEIKGDANIAPEMWLQKVGAGDVTIRNLSAGQTGVFSLKGLLDGEIVHIDPSCRLIESNLQDRYLYDGFSGHYVQFVTNILGDGSMNRLQVTGGCRIKFQYRYLWTGA